jgi:hypothetical protein
MRDGLQALVRLGESVSFQPLSMDLAATAGQAYPPELSFAENRVKYFHLGLSLSRNCADHILAF